MNAAHSLAKVLLSTLWVGSVLTSALAYAGPNEPAQTPLFANQSVAPLNMLVMGRDHKLYYEAYNDASDLNGDGVLDVGFKPAITYYGYFNSSVCYSYSDNRFEPTAKAGDNNTCSSAWSGNFLNYLATSRMDALRKVLYGGYRATDSTSETVLRAAFIPQDAHSSGKEYDSRRDSFNIGDYTPLSTPPLGFRHLFAVTTLSNDGTPILRVLTNSSYRIWEWVSRESPVAGDYCGNGNNLCTNGGSSNNWAIAPADLFPNGLTITTWKDSTGNPTNESGMNSLFNSDSSSNRCGTGTVTNINTTGGNNNPFTGNSHNKCTHDNYHTLIEGTLRVPVTGSYQFAVNGDDAVDFYVGSTRVASWYGEHGADSSAATLTSHSGSISLTAGTNYTVKFRHEEGSGDDSWQLWYKPANAAASTRTDYALNVVACPSDANLREGNCKAYNGDDGTVTYKPTGILHDFGENDSMQFALLTGSYAKNTKGGVLRSNIGSFTREVNSETGQFNTSFTAGIVSTLNKLRIVDFNSSRQYSNCSWIVDAPITAKADGVCSMWGNPLAEMMFEGLRYFAGATAGSNAYTYASGARDTQSDLELPAPTWVPPYTAKTDGGGGAESCAVPVMTVISDINPSYDFTLPGSRFNEESDSFSLPTKISTLNVSTTTDEIGAAEGINGNSYFIGQSTSDNADSAPTAKVVDNLSWARGLSPEEPSKQGTFYSAGIAKFGAENAVGGDKKMLTYSIALASPLPQIKFPIGTDGNQSITLVPFAKSVGGGGVSATSAFQPTNQIVDYYVVSIANTGLADRNPSVNGGRPFAQFRINYEDVEQGADHDMDAISLYTLSVEANGSLKVKIDSEYAAGGIIQLMGYVISGTTADGIYLEVRDKDTNGEHPYKLSTPAGQAPGYCSSATNLAKAECKTLPLTTERTFSATSNPAAGFLKNPLWYAAKYGVPGRNPTSVTGDPSNYFLVTNALTLKDQLTNAFNDILQKTTSVTSPAVALTNPEAYDSERYVYRTSYDVENWTGDLIKETTDTYTGLRSEIWKASASPRPSNVVKMADADGSGLADFSWSNIGSRGENGVYAGVNLQQALATDPERPDLVPELNEDGTLANSADVSAGTNRVNFIKSRKLGDIINSSPAVVEKAMYLPYLAQSIEPSGNYAAFAEARESRAARVYVGANDGMLHAFNTTDGSEEFAFVPSEVIQHLNKLTHPGYNKKGNQHQYYVDGTPVVRDVFFDDEWHTVLVGTLRGGGRSIFALDITDPDNIDLLWEFSVGDDLESNSEDPSDIGYSFPVPTLARLHSGQWAVITGNGYDSPSGRAALLLIDIGTGELVRKIPVETSGDNGLSSVRVADNNSDGVADYVYAGDLQGNLWRFDLLDTSKEDPFNPEEDVNASVYKVSFGGKPLFSSKDRNPLTDEEASEGVTPPSPQAITAAPSLVRHPSLKGYIVMFGSGAYFRGNDRTNTQVQTLYGIWDQQTKGETASTTPVLNRANLQAQQFTLQTSTSFSDSDDSSVERTIRVLSDEAVNWKQDAPSDTEGKYGWYLDFKVGNTKKGERVVDEMFARGQVLFLNTRSPESDPCKAGVDGWTYGINPYTGGRTSFNVFDLSRNSIVDSKDSVLYEDKETAVSGYQSPAGGITLSGGTLFNTDGSVIKVDTGPSFNGRQSWQAIPDVRSPVATPPDEDDDTP